MIVEMCLEATWGRGFEGAWLGPRDESGDTLPMLDAPVRSPGALPSRPDQRIAGLVLAGLLARPTGLPAGAHMTPNLQVFCRRCARLIADFSSTTAGAPVPAVHLTDACALCAREPREDPKSSKNADLTPSKKKQ